MTKQDVLSRIDELIDSSDTQLDPDGVADMRRLVELLPPKGLTALKREWVRIDAHRSDRIDLFWSQSPNFMDQGNRILSIHSLGGGEFRVDLSNPFAVEWQRSPENRPIDDRLSLNSAGAEELLGRLVDWQLSKEV